MEALKYIIAAIGIIFSGGLFIISAASFLKSQDQDWKKHEKTKN